MTESATSPWHRYSCDPAFGERVAYFSMEFAIHQPLKTYAGGLGYLAGSYMRSAYDLQQNLIGIGILWKYGYYDQIRKGDQGMAVLFQEKVYGFLQKVDVQFTIQVNGSPVYVTAYYLPPAIYHTAPIFFLTTDLPENDYLAQTICHRLYNPNLEATLAASILLGIGGAKLLDLLHLTPDVYHLNEAHALPLAFYLYGQYGRVADVKKRLVFTNHTPEEAGNPKTNIHLLERMGYFGGLPLATVREITGANSDILDHTAAALRLAKISNGVSVMHGVWLRRTWQPAFGVSPIIAITNAQNQRYWADKRLMQALEVGDDQSLLQRKKHLKRLLFEEVADQTGELYHEDVLTIVWARRFAGYKRADLLLHDFDRFIRMLTQTQYPVQIIWAGKPYPEDYTAISVFDRLAQLSKKYANCSILVGYELKLSRLLKQGADVWLNTPRLTHEASGTSGMTAAMNGAINVSVPDGWTPEFARHGENSFLVPALDPTMLTHEQDSLDARHLMEVLEKEVLPMYYTQPDRWLAILKQSMREVVPYFDSDRMARQYYQQLYRYPAEAHEPSPSRIAEALS